MKQLTQEQKNEIRRNVFRLPAEKRHKILQMISYLQEYEDPEEDEATYYAVMLTYMDKSQDKKLDEDFKKVMNSPSAIWDTVEEGRKGKRSSVPKKVILKKDK